VDSGIPPKQSSYSFALTVVERDELETIEEEEISANLTASITEITMGGELHL